MRLCNEPRRSMHCFAACNPALKASDHMIELVTNVSSHDKKVEGARRLLANGLNCALVVIDRYVDSFSIPLICVVAEGVDESS